MQRIDVLASLSKSQKSRSGLRQAGSAVADARRQADELVAAGMARHRQGDLEGAFELYGQALELVPVHPGALYLGGTVQLQSKRPDIAEAMLRKSLEAEPNQAQALGNLGLALSDMGRRDEAVEALRSAVRLQPDSPDLQANLGRVLRQRGIFDQAAEAYRRAIALAPDRAGLHSGLGMALTGAKKDDEAVEAHRRALELAPDKPEYLNNYAQSLQYASRGDEAEALMRQVVNLAPDVATYRAELGRILKEGGKYGEAIGAFRQARDMGSRNPSIDPSLIWFQNHLLDADPRALKQDAMVWAEKTGQGVTPFAEYPNDPDPERRIRVGLVSGDFRGHPVGRFLEAPMHAFDRSRISLYAYSAEDNDDPINLSLRRSIANWRRVKGMPDRDLAELIRKDQIDVLIDLSGHTAFNRLPMFIHKPAPVSATWLGYFATTGIAAIDYVICNRWLLPPEEEYQWVERPWYMPSAHWCYYRPKIDIEVAETPAEKNGYVTFGCYNNFDKLNRDTIACWAEIMRRMPDCRMVIRSSNKNPGIMERVVEYFAAEGFTAGERLKIDNTSMAYDDHMRSYGLLDIALDPFPYNGGTTTVEALYMGVPVITRHGDRFVAHMSESNVRSAGLDEWVAADTEDYVRLAMQFGGNVPGLSKLRTGLRERVLASRLFDAQTFAHDLEDTFRGMWRAWCAAQRKGQAATISSAS